ncbi:MAG: hypothetical protein II245_07005, partial [Bacteroidaceae bacterium]|nr:hypothetical protein [Bacteroidaceae bacterium]
MVLATQHLAHWGTPGNRNRLLEKHITYQLLAEKPTAYFSLTKRFPTPATLKFRTQKSSHD